MNRASKFAFAISFLALAGCHSTSSSDAAGSASASAAPAVSSWPVLPADPVDAMAAADEDPVIVAYGHKAGNSLTLKYRECIEKELPKNPNFAGSVIMVADVKDDGTVASVKPTELTGYNGESMKCLTSAIKSAHLPPPPADHTIIKMPFILTHR